VIIGVDLKWTPAISALTGTLAVIYTALGGLRTVVITDFVQFMLLLLGAVLTIVPFLRHYRYAPVNRRGKSRGGLAGGLRPVQKQQRTVRMF
jgi:Na+(H+)/acetate symporter ActP